MTFRSVLGKLGSKSCIDRNTRSMAIMVGISESPAINYYRYCFSISKPHSGFGYSSRHPIDFGHHQNKALLPRSRSIPQPKKQIDSKSCGPGPIGWICKSRFDYMVTPLARFAVEEFNKNKNGQLQFVRVIRASSQGSYNSTCYFLTLEAVDDAGVVKVYRALVWSSFSMELILFGLVIDNKSLLKLIDRRRSPGIELPIDNRDYLRERCRKKKSYLKKKKVPTKTSGHSLVIPSLGERMLKNLLMLPLQ